MAGTAISRPFLFPLTTLFCKRTGAAILLHLHTRAPPATAAAAAITSLSSLPIHRTISSLVPRIFTFSSRPLCSSSEPTTNINTKVNFSLPDSDSDSDDGGAGKVIKEIDRSKLQPPYDPFKKKPSMEDPTDPKDLQQIFHNMRADGFMNNAVKMFDGLSKDGLTHEALELFAQIKDKGKMPDVVAHTAVIEAYANAGQSKEAIRTYMRMLASGVLPNAYTYSVLIRGLAAAGMLEDAKKYVVEMMVGRGMRPNARTYTAVFEAFAREEKVEEAKEFLNQMKANGFVPDEKAVWEALGHKTGPVCRFVINILFDSRVTS